MKETVALAKGADAKKGFSPTKSADIIHRDRNEPERQLGSLRSVIGNIRRDGGTPSIESVATQLSSMHTVERASTLLALQCTHGNRFVQRVVAGIQAKLKVGQPGDIYEQEADRVAGEVMRMPEPRVQRQTEEEKKKEEELVQAKPLSEQITPLVQRLVEEEELVPPKLETTAKYSIQRQEEEEEKEEILQTKNVPNQTLEVTPDLESRIQTLRGVGQFLPKSVRAFFEPRFGYDFSQVCIHTNSQATETARAVNAQAFTMGHGVWSRAVLACDG